MRRHISMTALVFLLIPALSIIIAFTVIHKDDGVERIPVNEEMIRVGINNKNMVIVTRNYEFEIRDKNKHKAITHGYFIDSDEYDKEYYQVAKKSEAYDTGNYNSNFWVYYENDDKEYNYIIDLSYSDQFVKLVNTESKESAEQAFKALKIHSDEYYYQSAEDNNYAD